MGTSVLPSFQLGEPGDVRSAAQERIAGLRGDVDGDGGAASFRVQFTNQRPFRVLIPFAEMPAILHEFRVASAEMVNRQAHSWDGGAEAMMEMCRTALRPSHIDGMIDRRNWDRTYFMQFREHAPLAITLSLTEAKSLRAQMDALARTLAH